MSKLLLFVTALLIPLASQGQENHYDLLNTLDPATAPVVSEDFSDSGDYGHRIPASVEPGQISVREKLPDAKLKKTARTLQWEVLRNKSKAPEELEEEPEE